jgi:hypothetical protein
MDMSYINIWRGSIMDMSYINIWRGSIMDMSYIKHMERVEYGHVLYKHRDVLSSLR